MNIRFYNRQLIAFITAVFLWAAQAAAQEQLQRINGKVISGLDGTALEGVTVLAVRSGSSTLTDVHGVYHIEALSNDTLRFSYMGYQSHIEAVAGQLTLDVGLHSADNTLDEAVIIAYGTTSRRLNTGNVGKVAAATIARQPVANPLATLQGRVPGLEVTQESGRTGSGFEVRVRGRNSIASGNEPLYLVDGMPWLSNSLSVTGNQSPFNSITPADIESIEVLKDADATAIYGSRGANGVILITTKKGRVGSTRMMLTTQAGWSRVGRVMPLMDTEQYLRMRKEALANDGVTPTESNAPDLLLYDPNRFTDWKDVLIGNTASLGDAQLALSGGSAATQFRLAGGFRRETNVYPGENANRRGNAQLSLSHRSSDGKLEVLLSTNYSNNVNNLLPDDLTSLIYTAPNIRVYEDDGSLAWAENGSANRVNPLGSSLQTYQSITDNLISNLNVSYALWSDLRLRITGGYATTKSEEKNVYPLESIMPGASRTSGNSRFGKSAFTGWSVEPQLNYNIAVASHRFEALVGASWQGEADNRDRIEAAQYSSEALLHTPSGASLLTMTTQHSQYRYQSVFGRINYRYRERYLVNLTGRRDGSSRFGPGNRFANFYAVGAAWIFSEEKVVRQSLPFLSFGKIRGSYGLTGNDKIGNYQFLDTYGSGAGPYQGVNGLSPQRLFNPVYRWESNRKLEFGTDIGFWNDRLLIAASWFRNRSGNQLLSYTLPAQTGFAGIIRNLPALVENRGWEFEISAANVVGDAFQWNTSFNLTRARNELLEFPGLESSSYSTTYTIGHSLNSLRLFKYLGVDRETGVWQVDTEAGRNVVKELDPQFYGGLNNSFAYRGIMLDVFFQFVRKTGRNFTHSYPALFGGANSNLPVAALRRWQQSGDVTDIQLFSSGRGIASTPRTNYLASDGPFTDASFIRLKNISLSYQLPQHWCNAIKVNQLRLYVLGQNLFEWTGFEGNDPEVTNMTVLPPLRTVAFGFQLTI